MHHKNTKRLAAVVAGLVTFAGLSAVSPVAADAAGDPIVLSGYNAARTDGDWGLTESYMSATRGYLTDPANFGPGGTVDRAYSISPTGVQTATAASLAGVDVFFTGWVVSTSYTAEEKAALHDFVLAGGTLIATTDDTGHTMVDAFGLTQGNGGGGTATVTNPTHAVADGPFGPVTSYQHYGTIGHYSSLGADAVEIGRNSSGASIAVIERGALGVGSGAVVFVADIDVLTTYGSGATTNATLIKNIFAFAATPTPWTLSGFYQPVDMGEVVNTVRAGRAVPLKFEIFDGDEELTSVDAVESITATTIACESGAEADAVEVTAAGGSELRYDDVAGQFVYNWKTPSTPGTCLRVTMVAADGTSISADFQLR